MGASFSLLHHSMFSSMIIIVIESFLVSSLLSSSHLFVIFFHYMLLSFLSFWLSLIIALFTCQMLRRYQRGDPGSEQTRVVACPKVEFEITVMHELLFNMMVVWLFMLSKLVHSLSLLWERSFCLHLESIRTLLSQSSCPPFSYPPGIQEKWKHVM